MDIEGQFTAIGNTVRCPNDVLGCLESGEGLRPRGTPAPVFTGAGRQ